MKEKSHVTFHKQTVSLKTSVPLFSTFLNLQISSCSLTTAPCKQLLFFLFTLLFLISPSSLYAVTFTQSDLEGAGSQHVLISDPITPSWHRCDTQGDAAGITTFSNCFNTSGSTTSPSATLSMDSSGVITISGDSTYHGVMSQDKQLIIATQGASSPMFNIVQKGSGTFTSSDLEGTWISHDLAADTSTPEWIHCTMQVVSGTASFSNCLDMSGGTTGMSPIPVSIDSSGVVSATGDPSFHGTMSADKELIIATLTGGSSPELLVFQKRTGTSFISSDLEGTWISHSLIAGSTPEWEYCTMQVDGSGAGTFSNCFDMSGSTATDPAISISIDSSGVVTISGELDFHGTMSADKELIVATDTDGSSPALFVFQKTIVTGIPTLTEIGAIFLILLIIFTGFYRFRRNTPVN